MNIIVVGIGKVGYTVAEQLTSEMHDVTVIDIDESVIKEVSGDLDVQYVNGNGASKKVLIEANVDNCDLLIALTGSDETNLLCCLLAKRLGANGTIARVRTPEYNDDIILLKESLGLSMAVNPEKEAAEEIFRILRFPSAKNIDSFSNGKIDLVSLTVNGNCSLCNNSLVNSFSKIKAKALVCALERGKTAIIPNGNTVIKEGDLIAVMAPPEEVSAFFKEINLPVSSVESTMLIGGGRLAHYLAAQLTRHKIKTTIIERNREVAEKLSLKFPSADIICGDGTNKSLLIEEGLLDVDAVCSLTGIDEENILLSLFTKSISPETKTVTKINKIAFQEVVRSLNLDSVIYPKDMTANVILKHVRSKNNNFGNNLETLYRIIDNKVEAMEFTVNDNCSFTGVSLENLNLRDNTIIGCINRKGNAFIPHGKDTIKIGDKVIVVTTIKGITDFNDIRE